MKFSLYLSVILIGVLSNSMKPQARELYWIPKEVKQLKGAILQQNGTSAGTSVIWTEYATQLEFAIMCGGDFSSDLPGSMQNFATHSGHPEFANLPVCTFGGSRGGWWSMTTADKNPSRIIAIVGGHCGIWPNNAGVPTLFPITEKDETFYSASKPISNDIITSFIPNRKKGALWGLAVDWGSANHGTRDWEGLALIYFHRTIAYRLPTDANTSVGLPQLKPYTESMGWLSDVDSSKSAFPELTANDSYAGDHSKASWMPDEYLAWVWRAFVSTQAAVSITSPAQVEYNKKIDLTVPLLTSSKNLITSTVKAGKSVKSVAFYDGNILLGTANQAPFEVNTCLDKGPHALIAIATEESGQKTSSNPVIVLVKTGVDPCSGTGTILHQGHSQSGLRLPQGAEPPFLFSDLSQGTVNVSNGLGDPLFTVSGRQSLLR